MAELRVGTGGWAYFQVPERDSLNAYASIFNFVEVNSTYYAYPSLKTVASWRTRVPDGFEFSVRCHQNLVQAFGSKNGLSLSRVVERMERICDTLRAEILSILVPAQSGLGDVDLESGLEEALATFHATKTRIAVELRGRSSPKIIDVLRRNDAIHSVDLSREEPAYDSNILYARLFGKGRDNVYEFDDEELETVAAKASAPRFEKSILAFHGVRMYRDAARLKTFLAEGQFPQITGQTGLDSLMEVLKEDVALPATRSELVQRQGWKLFDLTENQRVRAQSFLDGIPEKIYGDLGEIRSSLETLFLR